MFRKIMYFFSLVFLSVLTGSLTLGSAQGVLGDSQVPEASITSAFTYQGRLADGGVPANGSYDFSFQLFTALAAGSQVGSTVYTEDVQLNEGYFTVILNFGATYGTQALWLEIGIRPGSSGGAYTHLSPRQPLTATPFASYSLKSPWGGLTGIPAGFADGIDDNTTYTAGDGLDLNGGQFSVRFAGSGVATTVARSDHTHLGQTWSGNDNALKIQGSFNTAGNLAPLVLNNQTGAGVYIGSTGHEGIYVDDAGWDGVRINSAGNSGISIGPSTYYGVSISSAGWAGVLVASTAGDAFHVNSADDNGLAVVTAGGYGVWAATSSSAREGGHFENSAAGGTGLFALAGSNSSADVVLGGTNATDDDGRVNSDLRYSSSDVLLTSNDAIQFNLDEDNNESGDFWIVNGANTTVFAVNESGDMIAIGTKSALVSTKSYGNLKLYAMESPENWFEDFGSSLLVNGMATVPIDPVFAETVNLDENYFVFLTPLGDCPLYVADKTTINFTIKAMGSADCSIAFDYRIVARRLGYENLRLESVDDQEVEP